MTKVTVLLAVVLTSALGSSVAAQASFSENFENNGTTPGGQHGPQGLIASGWEFRNQSEPTGSGDWIDFNYAYQGQGALHVNRTVGTWVDDQSEASSWAVLPALAGQIAGDELRFFYASIPPSIFNPEQPTAHLEVRYSPSGGTSTGSGAEDLGDFTTLLADLPDPAYQIFAEFKISVPGNGRIAFRFNVPPNPIEEEWWGSFHLDNMSVGPAVQGPPLPAAGQTVNWTAAMSPIDITEVTTIATGGTVIIDPGVIVNIDPSATLTVNGALSAMGLPGQPVTLQGGAQIDVFGDLHLEQSVVDVRCYGYGSGSTINGRNSSFLKFGYVFTSGVGSYPAFLDFDSCTFTDTLFRVGSCILRLTNCSFVRSFCEIGGSNMFLDGVTFDEATQTGLNIQFFLQPVWLNNITIRNSTEAGLDLVAANVRLGPDVPLFGNQYPAQIGGSGFLPRTSLPATGNANNYINVEFASAGLAAGNVWADTGIPYVVPTYYSAGILDILQGVHLQLGPSVDFFAVAGPVTARGTPTDPVLIDRLFPSQPWHGLQKFHRFENCIIDGGIVGARFNSITFPGFIDDCVIQNCDNGVQNDGIVRKTRFLNNTVGVWESNWPDSLDGAVGGNSFAGNTMAVQSLDQIIDAPNNWWNHPSGPDSNDNPEGRGETVTGNVTTRPFLTSPPDFDDHPPLVKLSRHDTLLEPNAKVILTWSSQDDSSVVAHRIEFDHPLAGAATTIVASGLPGTARAYEWTVPDIGFAVNGKQPRIRVVAIDDAGQEGWDSSDHIIPSGEMGGTLSFLTDLSGPFVSGAPTTEQLCWDSSGLTGPSGSFVASIHLGADRTSVPLGSTFSSCLPGSTIGMPFVSTDTARVSIAVQSTTNRVKHFFSEPFSIRSDARLGDAPPTITMISPRAGQVLAGGTTVPITWLAADDEALQAFHIQASYDAGHTWHFLAEDLSPTTTSFAWKLPPTTGIPDVRVRVIAVDQRFQNTSDGGSRSLSIVNRHITTHAAPVGPMTLR